MCERARGRFRDQKGGGQKIRIEMHGGKRQIGRQRQIQDGGRQVDLAQKDAGPKALESA